MSRDHVAELLSLVRYAYASGYRDGSNQGRFTETELLYAASEAAAIEYVTEREQYKNHPLARLIAELSRSKP